MKVRFFVTKGKNTFVSIHVRFWDSNRIDQKAKTGLSTYYSHWSDKKECIRNVADAKQRDFINNKLKDLERYILDGYNTDFNNGVYIGKTWLKSRVNSFFGRVDESKPYESYYIDWIAQFIEQSPKRLYKGKPLAKNTLKNYISTYNKLVEFEKKQGTKYKFEDINLQFYYDFVDYCRTGLMLGDGTIGSLIKRIKFFCRRLEEESYPISPNYKHRDFITLTNETLDTYLNKEEINILYSYDLSNYERLENARDWFVIGCWTGLRSSDLLRLSKENIIKDSIKIVTQKTNKLVMLPIHKHVKEILNKRNGEFPREITQQRLNDYIKEVCKMVGFNEVIEGAIPVIYGAVTRKTKGMYPKYKLIGTHTARRSFATNHYGELPTNVIMSATGHSSEKTFMQYIKTTKKEHAETLRKHWEVKEGKLIDLKIKKA